MVLYIRYVFMYAFKLVVVCVFQVPTVAKQAAEKEQCGRIAIHFFHSSTTAFNYYKLKSEECLCISHELRVEVVNFDINYLCISPIEKFEVI